MECIECHYDVNLKSENVGSKKPYVAILNTGYHYGMNE